MSDQDDELEHGQFFNKDCIEQHCDQGDCDREKGGMPAFEDDIWVDQDCEAFDLHGGGIRDRREAHLPAEDGEPSNGVAQNLLQSWRSELGDPVILPAFSHWVNSNATSRVQVY